MKTSKEGIDLLIELEGFKTKAYKDSGGLWTIGVGHLIRATEKDLLKKVLTYQEVVDLLSNDLIGTENCINLLVKEPVEQHKYDALVCLTFNIGCGNLKKSSVLRFLNLKQYDRIEQAWLMWKYDAHREPILLNRRIREYELFKNNIYKPKTK